MENAVLMPGGGGGGPMGDGGAGGGAATRGTRRSARTRCLGVIVLSVCAVVIFSVIYFPVTMTRSSDSTAGGLPTATPTPHPTAAPTAPTAAPTTAAPTTATPTAAPTTATPTAAPTTATPTTATPTTAAPTAGPGAGSSAPQTDTVMGAPVIAGVAVAALVIVVLAVLIGRRARRRGKCCRGRAINWDEYSDARDEGEDSLYLRNARPRRSPPRQTNGTATTARSLEVARNLYESGIFDGDFTQGPAGRRSRPRRAGPRGAVAVRTSDRMDGYSDCDGDGDGDEAALALATEQNARANGLSRRFRWVIHAKRAHAIALRTLARRARVRARPRGEIEDYVDEHDDDYGGGGGGGDNDDDDGDDDDPMAPGATRVQPRNTDLVDSEDDDADDGGGEGGGEGARRKHAHHSAPLALYCE